MIVDHGLGRLLDLGYADRPTNGAREAAVNVGNLLDLAPDLAHDAGAIERLGAAAAGEVERATTCGGGAMCPSWPRAAGPRQQAALDNLARVLLLVLAQAGEGVLELVLALFDGGVVLALVLFPDAVPLAGVLGLVLVGLVFDGELALDELQPDLAGATVELGRVDFDAAQLWGVVDAP